MEHMLSEKGRKLIVLEGYKFYKFRKTSDGWKWRCTTNHCKSKLHLDEEATVILKAEVQHNHDPPKNLERQMISNSVKQKAKMNLTERPQKLICKVVTSAFPESAGNINVKDIRCIRKNMYRARCAVIPSLPQSVNEDNSVASSNEEKSSECEEMVQVKSEPTDSEDNSESKWLASKKFEFSSEKNNPRETLDAIAINDDRPQSNLEKRFDESQLSLNESERSLNQAEEFYEEDTSSMEGNSRVQYFSEPLAKKKRTPNFPARPPTRYDMQTVPGVQTTHGGQEINPFDLFGKYIAAELRQLSQRQAVLLQQELQNCITNFKLSILQPEPMHLVYNSNEKFSNHQPEVLIPSINDD